MVERYEITRTILAETGISDRRTFVRWEDYRKSQETIYRLTARISTLEAQLAELTEENERLTRQSAANADHARLANENQDRMARALKAANQLAEALSRTGAVKVDAAYLRETLAWVRRNMDKQPSQAKQQIDLALGSILSAIEPGSCGYTADPDCPICTPPPCIRPASHAGYWNERFCPQGRDGGRTP